MRSLLREPLLHFLALGALLFAVHGYESRGSGGVEPSKRIQLTVADLNQVVTLFRSQWSRPPTPDELRQMVEGQVQEEVLYREALALGLDRDDTIVRRRMAQKMQFLLEDEASDAPPPRAELEEWYASHAGSFALPERRSFRHLYFSPDRRGERARDDAAKALAKLAAEPEDSKLADALADPFMFQDYYRDRTPDSLAKEFGPPFAKAVAGLTPGSWQGPVESGFGWHLVFVDLVVPGRIPALEEIEPDVETAWRAERKDQAWHEAYDEMRAKYTVLLPAPPEPATR